MLLLLQVLFFGLTYWLGLYLFHRDWQEPRLRWTGLGLVSYALGMGIVILQISSTNATLALQTVPAHQTLSPSTYWWLLALPALFWTGAAIHLLPSNIESDTKLDGASDPFLSNWVTKIPWPTHLIRFWRYGQLPMVALLVPLFLVALRNKAPQMIELLQIILGLILLLPLGFILLLLTVQIFQNREQRKTLLGLVSVATLLFDLSIFGLLLPFNVVDQLWLLLGAGADLILLGVVIVWRDAFEQGETFKVDLLLSLDGAILYSLLFGGLVGMVIYFSTGITTPMLLLLLLMVMAAITVQMYAGAIQASLDRVVFSRFPQAREERATLRAVAEALPKRPPDPVHNEELENPMHALLEDEKELVRITRRALSALGDLGKLAISPLIELAIVEQHLLEKHPELDGHPTNGNTLQRAQALQAVLFDAIAQLRPADSNRNSAAFGTTGQWRYYNALYYPYVIGLKPYSRRVQYNSDELENDVSQALEWFRSQVPERTLYNWQTAGAKLVAQSLREQEMAEKVQTPC